MVLSCFQDLLLVYSEIDQSRNKKEYLLSHRFCRALEYHGTYLGGGGISLSTQRRVEYFVVRPKRNETKWMALLSKTTSKNANTNLLDTIWSSQLFRPRLRSHPSNARKNSDLATRNNNPDFCSKRCEWRRWAQRLFLTWMARRNANARHLLIRNAVELKRNHKAYCLAFRNPLDVEPRLQCLLSSVAQKSTWVSLESSVS